MKPVSVPDKWLAGYLRTHPDATPADAAAYFVEQARLDTERMARIRRRLRTLPPFGKVTP